MAKMAMPVKVYPNNTDKGPARVKAVPIPKNRPVPIVPPRAMNWMCLDLSLDEDYHEQLWPTILSIGFQHTLELRIQMPPHQPHFHRSL